MIKKLLASTAISGTFIVTIGVFIGSFFSYLLQFFLGRALSLEDFGIFNTLLSFAVILGVFGGALSVSVVKKVSSLCAKNSFDILTKLFWHLSLIALGLGSLLFLILFGFRIQIANFLNIPDFPVVTFFAGFMGLTFLSMVPNSYLQGLLRFKALAFYGVFAAFLRLLIPSVLVLFGYSVSFVFLGMSLAILISFLIAILLLRKNFNSFKDICLINHYKGILAFLGPLVFMGVGLTLLNNMDMIFVKHFFSGDQAGVYSGLVTVGKVLLFGAGSVATVMFPQISADFTRGENPKKKFGGFLAVQLLLVVCGTAFFTLFPRFITVLMFGEKYLPAVEYLPKFSIFMAFYVLINFFVLFFMAVEKYLPILFLGIGVLLQIALISVFHDSLGVIVNVNVFVTGLVLFLLVVYYKFKDI